MAGLNGYAPLRRGILEHLADMSGNEFKCYGALIVMAAPRTGSVRITTRDLAETLGTSSNRASEALHRLAAPHGHRGTRYIEWTPAVNQHTYSEVHILNWRSVWDAAPDTAPVAAPVAASGQQAGSKRAAPGQHTGSEQGKGDLESPYSPESHESLEEGRAPEGAMKVKCDKCHGTGRAFLDPDDPKSPRGFCDACAGLGEVAA